MTWLSAALAILAVTYLLHRKRKPPASGWQFDRWTQGVALRMVNGLPAFDFPASGKGVGYLQCRNPKLGNSITMRFRIEGGPFTAQEFPDRQATVTLVIQRKGEGEYASYRWYSSQTVPLEAGEFTLSVPLDILDWGPVQGTKSLYLFNQALKNVESIGFTFGSAGGRGHGVRGSGRFTLLWMGVS